MDISLLDDRLIRVLAQQRLQQLIPSQASPLKSTNSVMAAPGRSRNGTTPGRIDKMLKLSSV